MDMATVSTVMNFDFSIKGDRKVFFKQPTDHQILKGFSSMETDAKDYQPWIFDEVSTEQQL